MRHPHEPVDVERLIEQADLSEAANSLARANFLNESARTTESGRNNVAMRIPSHKTRQSRDTESRIPEYAQALLFEHGPRWLYYVTQAAAAVEMECPHCHGHWTTTADFFAMAHRETLNVETRTAKRITKVLAKHPGFYVPTATPGEFDCPAAAKWAAAHDTRYVVRTPEFFKGLETQNLNDLHDFYDLPMPPTEKTKELLEAISARPGISRGELIAAGTNPVHFNILAVQGAFYYDQIHERITDPGVHCYLDRVVAAAYEGLQPLSVALGTVTAHSLMIDAGARFLLADRRFEIVAPGIDDILVQDLDSLEHRTFRRIELERFVAGGVITAAVDSAAVLAVPNPVREHLADVYGHATRESRICAVDRDATLRERDAAKAARRAARRAARERDPNDLATSKLPPAPNFGIPRSERTYRRWNQRQREGLADTGDRIAGLIPRPHSGGGRQLTPDVAEALVRTIKDHHLVPNPLGPSDIRRLVEADLKAKGLEALTPAERTVKHWIKKVSREARILAHKGRKAADAVRQFRTVSPDESLAPTRAWQLFHYDTTVWDGETVCPFTGRALGRPNDGSFTDGFTGDTVLDHFFYEGPSGATILEGLRLLAEKYHRLPECLVIDQAPEHHGEDLQRFATWWGMTIIYRPAGQPRFGSPVERSFLERARIASRLEGQTSFMRNPRELTREMNAVEHALWDISSLDFHVGKAREMARDIVRQRTGETPREREARSELTQGVSPYRIVDASDIAFLAWTLPTVERVTRKINSITGINANYLTYWNDALAAPSLDGLSVEVRYDPRDMSRIFAFVNGVWLECRSRELASVRIVSYAEWGALSTALRERNRQVRKARLLSGASIAAFILEGFETEKSLKARLQAQAERAKPIQEDGPSASQSAPAEHAAPGSDKTPKASTRRDVFDEGEDELDDRFWKEAS
jgi:putative transposase